MHIHKDIYALHINLSFGGVAGSVVWSVVGRCGFHGLHLSIYNTVFIYIVFTYLQFLEVVSSFGQVVVVDVLKRSFG